MPKFSLFTIFMLYASILFRLSCSQNPERCDVVPANRTRCSVPRDKDQQKHCLQRGCCYDSKQSFDERCYKAVDTACTGARRPTGRPCPGRPTGGPGKRPDEIGRGGRGPSNAKFYSTIAAAIPNYAVEELLMDGLYAYLLPRKTIENLTLSDVDMSTFGNLPDTKRLTLTRQTLQVVPHTQFNMTLTDYFTRLGCSLLPGIPVHILATPGAINLDLAMDLCACNTEEPSNTPAKVQELCKVIHSKIRSFKEFQTLAQKMCPECFVYLMEERSEWEEKVQSNLALKSLACNKIGSSFRLLPTTLSKWAHICRLSTNDSACEGLWPSLMAYQPSLPSPANVAKCKDIFCRRLCHFSQYEIQRIQSILHKDHNEDVGCLAYLDGMNTLQEGVTLEVNATSLPGSCVRRSRIIKRAQEANQHRRKRSCSVSCEDIEFDITFDIDPPDVLDVTQINTCLETGNFSSCVEENNLGDYRWDVNQARALFEIIRESRTIETIVNWSGFDLGILGFIGVGFTPQELDTLDGFNNNVFAAFGAAHGWSPEQRRALAQRYLRDNNITALYKLTNVDLVRLNHIVCGLTLDQIKEIKLNHLTNSMPVLGDMVRCEIEVLKVLADTMVLFYGPFSGWPEDHFSEFGIMLAGLQGETLRSVGTSLSDHVTVPFVNHIPPAEFRKLSTEQTSLFSYDVALACSRRGLCAWLSEPPQHGYLQSLCPVTGAAFHTPTTTLLLQLSTIIIACLMAGGDFL